MLPKSGQNAMYTKTLCGNKLEGTSPELERTGSHGRREAGIIKGKVQDWFKQRLTKCKSAWRKQRR